MSPDDVQFVLRNAPIEKYLLYYWDEAPLVQDGACLLVCLRKWSPLIICFRSNAVLKKEILTPRNRPPIRYGKRGCGACGKI